MPTKDEIRSAYEALSKATRITTRKTTRGMVITVCNYELYQNVHSYASHTADLKETATKPSATPHDTERIKRSNEDTKPSVPPKQKKAVSPDALRLSEILADGVLTNNPNNISLSNGKRDATVKSWAADIDKLIQIDNRPPSLIERVIRWSQSDTFWKVNILSGAKLRAKWDTLTAKMPQASGQQHTPKEFTGVSL